jgi:hypothetical protein
MTSRGLSEYHSGKADSDLRRVVEVIREDIQSYKGDLLSQLRLQAARGERTVEGR